MDKEVIKQISDILDKEDIDERIKSLMKLYFLGKSTELNKEELENQINTLCSRISSVEFSSDNIVASYTKELGILTINKQLFMQGRSDEVILPIFMKFESALNQDNRRDYANNIEDFIEAGKIAQIVSAPISDRLYKLCEMARYCYSSDSNKIDKYAQEGAWRAVCSKFNDNLNTMVITGKDNSEGFLNGISLFHNEVFTVENFENPDFIGPYKNEEYQKRAARVLGYIDDNNKFKDNGLLKNIKLFTGCTQEMIEEANMVTYKGNSKIGDIIESDIKSNSTEITEDFIVSKVQAVIDKKQNWNSRIKHLIIPYFIRCQKIYNWDIDNFQERLNELDLKIDTIEFENLEDLCVMADTATNRIRLNSKVFFDRFGKPQMSVLKSLFHELGHVTDENHREGIETRKAIQDSMVDMGRFYEWTNSVFERMVGGGKFYRKDDAMLLEPSGYEALAPLGSMLSCALGISETEFVKIKDKGRKYEEQWLEKVFPESGDSSAMHGKDVVEKAKDIFDEYELDTYFSLGKKISNQDLLNDMYAECLKIMQKRIEEDLKRNDIKDMETYKKEQMFFLKKMNYNYKYGSKTDGFRLKKVPIVHSIDFCADNISKEDFEKIAKEQVAMADFGFDNSTIGKYNKNIVTSSNNKKSFLESIHFKLSNVNKTEKRKEEQKDKTKSDDREK